MNNIGKKIKKLRINNNITQEELSKQLSISYQAISKWENNLANPDIELIPVIAKFFKVTIDELFGYRLDSLTYKERFTKFMFENGVLNFGEFTLNSGRKSPYFINTGNYKMGKQILKLGEFYANCIKDNNIKADTILGPAYKGIPLAITTAIAMFNKYGINMNYCFDRKEEKTHGEKGLLVGKQLEDYDKVIIVEDTMTSGKDLRNILPKIKQIANVEIVGIIISVDRLEGGIKKDLTATKEFSDEFGIDVISIVDIKDIFKAIEDEIVPGLKYLETMKKYFKDSVL
jgi:orotate phosphoribosyltransferase